MVDLDVDGDIDITSACHLLTPPIGMRTRAQILSHTITSDGAHGLIMVDFDENGFIDIT